MSLILGCLLQSWQRHIQRITISIHPVFAMGRMPALAKLLSYARLKLLDVELIKGV